MGLFLQCCRRQCDLFTAVQRLIFSAIFRYKTHNPFGLPSSFISVSNLCSLASCLVFAWLFGKSVKISRSFLDFFLA